MEQSETTMKTLLTLSDKDIFPQAETLDTSNFFERQAGRAVVLNDKNQVHLLKINLNNYHKLPGGGIEDGENIKTGLRRELIEEIGCEAEIISDVGIIIEYRNEMKWIQTSYCYIARQAGRQGPPSLEQSEIDEGAEPVLVDDIDEAINQLEQDRPADYEGKFIQKRDLVFLKAAKQIMGSSPAMQTTGE